MPTTVLSYKNTQGIHNYALSQESLISGCIIGERKIRVISDGSNQFTFRGNEGETFIVILSPLN